VECLGSWYRVRDLVVPQGIDLRLGHAKYLKAISYAKVKTDRVDVRTLAQLLRAGLVPEAHMISPELREVRDLLRARLKLVTRASRARQHRVPRCVCAAVESRHFIRNSNLPSALAGRANRSAPRQTLRPSAV
jgi:hypothetical protein